MRAAFARADSDHSGSLSKDELAAVLKQCGYAPPPSEMAAAIEPDRLQPCSSSARPSTGAAGGTAGGSATRRDVAEATLWSECDSALTPDARDAMRACFCEGAGAT